MAICKGCDGRGYNERKDNYGHGVIETEHVGCTRCGGSGASGHSLKKLKYGTGKEGGCFTSDTLITTPCGEKRIGNIVAGEKVVSISKSGEISHNLVLEKKIYANASILKICLDNGITISTTTTHSFLLLHGWTRAKHIQPGDILCGSKGDLKVLDIYLSEERECVYNLVVEGSYTFIASGVNVHCFSWMRRVRMFIWDMRVAFGMKSRKYAVSGGFLRKGEQLTERVFRSIAMIV